MRGLKRLKSRVVICFSLGFVLLMVAIVFFVTAPGRVDKMLGEEELNIISEEKREKLLDDGYTEVIVTSKHVTKTSAPSSDGYRHFLYIFDVKSMDEYFAVNLSEKDNKISRYCEGMQIFCKGELKPEQIKISGEIYETLCSEDEAPKVYDWPGEEFETAKEEKLEEQKMVALCVATPGVLMCLIGCLSLFFVKSIEKKDQANS